MPEPTKPAEKSASTSGIYTVPEAPNGATAWTYEGKLYEPGEQDMPTAHYDAIKSRFDTLEKARKEAEKKAKDAE